MGSKELKNLPESIRAKLLHISKEGNRDFNAILLQYIQERFLYRLSVSTFSGKLILKGALLLLIKDIERYRPTKDIDFLAKGIKNKPDQVKEIILKIIKIPCEDGIEFISDSIETTIIKEGAQYEGLRIGLTAKLGKIIKKISIDLGFGDKIFGNPIKYTFPVLLDHDQPKIYCYPLEAVIAEKFHAIAWLNFQTSRLKDFYDIYYISQNYTFNSQKLLNAIKITFTQRNTDLNTRQIIYSEEFKSDRDKEIQWHAFLSRNKMDLTQSFKKIVERIEAFLEPVLKDTQGGNKIWHHQKQQWEK